MAQALLGLEANNPKPKPVRPEVSKNRAECRSHGSSSVSAEHVEARRSSPAPVRAEPVEAFPLHPPVRAEVSKPCSKSVIRCFGEPGAALSPRRATHLSLASPRESKQREGDPGACVPPLRYGRPAVLSPAGVPLELGCRLRQSRALIRLGFRSSAHSQGFEVGRVFRDRDSFSLKATGQSEDLTLKADFAVSAEKASGHHLTQKQSGIRSRC